MKRLNEEALLGDGQFVQYPGHPTVLAALIVMKFPSFGEASVRLPGATYPRALGDEDIPGAGSSVYAALGILEMIGKVGIDDALIHAEDYWTELCAGDKKFPGEVELGREQAVKAADYLRSAFPNWPQ